MKFSERIGRVEPSPTLAITSKAKAMIAEGIDVVSFGAGEPDFDTPEPVKAAAKRALDEGKTGYTPAAGIPELRALIAGDYHKRGREVSAEQVLVSVGGKHALYNATQVLFGAGDAVIIPAPYWVSYPAQVKLADAEPVFTESTLEDDFKLKPETLAEILESRDDIRGLVLCSPSNPTGATYSERELSRLGDVLVDYPDVVILFDAMYDRLYYDGDYAPDFVNANPELADRTLTFNGFSKTYAMTGWRLGYTIASNEVISQMAKLQSQSTSNPTSFAQYGALAALELDDSVISQRRDVFKRRRDMIVEKLNAIPGITCPTPRGAFYVFPDFTHFTTSEGRFPDDLHLAKYLLEDARVAVVHGSAFGAPGHARLSYATSDELIEEGIARIAAALG
jgi:aspartate aminotransferase